MGGCYLCGSKPGKTKSNHSPNEQYLRSRHIYISSTRSSCDLPERHIVQKCRHHRGLHRILSGSLSPSSRTCVPTRRPGRIIPR
ncbi:hypothetical protein BCR42DRAFT_429462 [Absidia repens]|uniref:Uncharacterized protein n=1 Tax=Absidia repens TaxID=90262 RepID=A0A1X2HWS1_9FUNG|nr:hypothetical protein BCR42DRAFT_429462 [Absidia repens]